MQKQIGAKINAELWAEMRVLALRQGRTATELLDEAMREYIERHSTDTPRWGSTADEGVGSEHRDKSTRPISKSLQNSSSKGGRK